MEEKKVVYVISELSAMALSIKKQLETLGYVAVPIFQPMDGIRQSIMNKPHSVIADFQFNQIMGLEVLQQIKIKYPDIHSVLLVNSETHPDFKRAIDLGSRVLVKPVELKKLEEVMKPAAAVTATATGTKNIMLVERSPNIRFKFKKLVTVPAEIVEAQNPYEFLEKYFVRQWDLIVFNVDNDHMSADDFLKTVIEKKIRPDKFILLSFQWDRIKQDKFLSRGFSHFAKVPLVDDEINPILSAMLVHH
jgi:DNA-binding NtrC family response regulator